MDMLRMFYVKIGKGVKRGYTFEGVEGVVVRFGWRKGKGENVIILLF